jgi:dCMP deaminase
LTKLDRIFANLEEHKQRSSDAETQVVAELRSDKLKIIEVNRFVSGAADLPNTRPDKYEFILHAEANAVYSAARQGLKTEGAVVYCTLSPCQSCIRTMFQAGIREIYYKDIHHAHNPDMKDIKVKETKRGSYIKMELANHD